MKNPMIRALAVTVCCLVFAADTTARQVLPLEDHWRLQSAQKINADGPTISTLGFQLEGWIPTTVPRTVLAALVDNGVFPDPYFGDNLKRIPGYRKAPWLVMPKASPFKVNWWYRTEFDLPKSDRGKQLSLHFDGINYQANIWLNGQRLADGESVKGMFRRFEFDVTDRVVFDRKNVLAVEITPPGQLPDKPYRTKQLQATTGWDDHNPYPPDMNMGIWRKVYLRATGPVVIRRPYVATDLDLPSLDAADLTVSAQLTNKSSKKLTGQLEGRIGDIAFAKKVELSPGEGKTVEFSPADYPSLHVKNPKLWWPNPVGPQHLHHLELSFTVDGRLSDRESVRFGIREVSTYINDEGWRGYKVNGKKILIRGGAWMTSDMLLRLSHRRYDALIRYAKEANLNMLRSEGFSIRETDEFYDLCDEYGIMVTQQIFGRNIPDSDLAIACIEDMMLRIRNHPSLVHFLGHDETFPIPKLDRAYRDLIAKYTPQRTYQPHSGAFNVSDRFKTGGTRTGTRELWTYANPSHYYTHKEDGAWGFAQSGGIGGIVAPYESMRRMMPAGDLWPPFTETWSFHTVTQGGPYFTAMIHALNTRYGKPKGIEEFCRKAQALNYDSARGMFEAYGRNKYDATGITTWKYDAAWPASPTWQYIDWYLVAGGAYYGAKKACEPLHVQYAYDDQSVYVINNFYRAQDGLEVTARLYDFDMTERFTRSAKVSVGSDGKTKAFKIEFPDDLTKMHFLALTLTDGHGRPVTDNLYWLSTVPEVPGRKGRKNGLYIIEPKSTADFTDLNTLPQVELKIDQHIERKEDKTIATVTVTNAGKAIAFQIHLAIMQSQGGAEVAPTYWSENYFSLLPGETREVRAAFATGDLGGHAPAVQVDGWNVKTAN